MATTTKISRKEGARRYLQADMDRSYTGLPAEAREIHEGTMRRLAREHGPDLPLLATVGTDRDFDAPLTPGEREHQKHMRSQLPDPTPQGIAEQRARLRGAPPTPAGRRPTPTPRRRAPGPRRAASAATGAVSDATSGRGNIFMQLLGWTLALSLIYLLVAGKGVNALSGIVSAIVGGVHAFVAPVDPIKSLEGALGATSTSTSTPASTSQLSPSALAPANSAGTGAATAPPPAANTPTWPWLRREVKAGHITKRQLVIDEGFLLHPTASR